MTVASPKQPQSERKRDWYPYYAGYRPEFVRDVIDQILPDSKRILDPWNGAGTTTATVSCTGRQAVGLDINPALSVVARARQTPKSVADSLLPLGRKLAAAAAVRAQSCAPISRNDMLTSWFRSSSASFLRELQKEIELTLSERELTDRNLAVAAMPVLAAFYHTALFGAVRVLLRSFRSSNPTWLRLPPTPQHRVGPPVGRIRQLFLDEVTVLRSKLVLADDVEANNAQVVLADCRSIPYDDGAFDGVITSPPYATRIDYVRGAIAELAILGYPRDAVDSLRSTTVGSPVVGTNKGPQVDLEGTRAAEILSQVRDHGSKGSRSYYHPWLKRYFQDMRLSIGELRRVTTERAGVALVVQDSYYKEIRVPLQEIAIEFMGDEGWDLTTRIDYAVSHLRSTMNTAARAYARDRRAAESLLVYN